MSETKKIWLDGAIVDESEAKISVFDHGLLYGDGIFEGIRFYNSRVFRLEEHVERLFLSAKAILLKMPWTEQEVIEIVCDSRRGVRGRRRRGSPRRRSESDGPPCRGAPRGCRWMRGWPVRRTR